MLAAVLLIDAIGPVAFIGMAQSPALDVLRQHARDLVPAAAHDQWKQQAAP